MRVILVLYCPSSNTEFAMPTATFWTLRASAACRLRMFLEKDSCPAYLRILTNSRTIDA